MMEVSKVLLYCTKKKPYLFENYTDKVTWDKVFARKFGEWNRFMLIGAKPDYIGSGNYYLNGFVCFECDCKEAFKYDFVHRSGDSSNFYIRDQRTERMKDCLSNDDLFDYGKGKTLYAYHLENVKAIEPFPITDLYQDGTMVYPLTRAPQSWRFAYRKAETTKDDYYANVGKPAGGRYYFHEGGGFFYSDKIILISIRSPYVALEANIDSDTGKPFKDLEIRKTRIANFEIEYK